MNAHPPRPKDNKLHGEEVEVARTREKDAPAVAKAVDGSSLRGQEGGAAHSATSRASGCRGG